MASMSELIEILIEEKVAPLYKEINKLKEELKVVKALIQKNL